MMTAMMNGLPTTAVNELTQVSALMATTPFRKWDRERGRDEKRDNKKHRLKRCFNVFIILQLELLLQQLLQLLQLLEHHKLLE